MDLERNLEEVDYSGRGCKYHCLLLEFANIQRQPQS